MNKQLTLLQKTWNYENIRILYHINTENISICMEYLNKERMLNYQKDYRQFGNGKIKDKRYAQSEKGKISNNKYQQSKKFIKTRKNYLQSKKGKKKRNVWLQSEKGKISGAKSKAKRKRNLQWIQMFENPFDKDVEVEWHHINDCYVVALPKELHKMYGGKFHREKIMGIVKQIYLD